MPLRRRGATFAGAANAQPGRAEGVSSASQPTPVLRVLIVRKAPFYAQWFQASRNSLCQIAVRDGGFG
jgi:hypothetical protein